MHCGEARGYRGWPRHKLAKRLGRGVRVGPGDGLAGLQAELEVGQPLLMLLARHVYPGLLTRVKLSVADPAEMLQRAGHRRTAPQTPDSSQSVIMIISTELNLPPLGRLAAGIGV